MPHDRQRLESQHRERSLAGLAASQPAAADELAPSDADATLAACEAELETLAGELRRPAPPEEFEEESACRRATALVETLGVQLATESPSEGGGPRAATAEPPPPESLGPYDLQTKLGEGGMGVIYLAAHRKLKRTVVVKVLHRRRTSDPAAVARFEREAEALGALRHPNIVTAHDAGEDAGMHYLVMEYVEGLDVNALVRRLGRVPVAEACEIARQAALGLAAAAERGIVHRDVKPSNLMLSAEAGGPTRVKILDFGLAQLSSVRVTEELTSSGVVLGTLRYMAPEQCTHPAAVDERADVYALGCTLYKLLCGRSPYADARYDSPLALLAALGDSQPTPALPATPSDVPPRLAALVAQMTAKNPADRMSTPGAVAAALETWAQAANLGAMVAEAMRREEPTREATPTAHTWTPATAERPFGRHSVWRRLWPVAAGLTLGVAGLVAALALSGRGESAGSQARSRRTAQWLALHNAPMVVKLSDGAFQEISPGATLPAQGFDLDMIDLSNDKLLRDEDLALIRRLPDLQTLGLSFTHVSDAGLRQLRDLPHLQHLLLIETRVTDEGLPHLRSFAALETLHLSKTPMTDEGLKILASIGTLRELALSGCNITDAGLRHLHALSPLRYLAITETRVTARGVAELQLCSARVPSNPVSPTRRSDMRRWTLSVPRTNVLVSSDPAAPVASRQAAASRIVRRRLAPTIGLGLQGPCPARETAWIGELGGAWNTKDNWTDDDPTTLPLRPLFADAAIIPAGAPAFATLEFMATLSVASGAGMEGPEATGTLTVSGSVANDGLIRVGLGGAGTSQLLTGANSRRSGAREVVLDDRDLTNQGPRLVGPSASPGTTQVAGPTIRGEGTVTGCWINNGFIRAEETSGDSSATRLRSRHPADGPTFALGSRIGPKMQLCTARSSFC